MIAGHCRLHGLGGVRRRLPLDEAAGAAQAAENDGSQNGAGGEHLTVDRFYPVVGRERHWLAEWPNCQPRARKDPAFSEVDMESSKSIAVSSTTKPI